MTMAILHQAKRPTILTNLGSRGSMTGAVLNHLSSGNAQNQAKTTRDKSMANPAPSRGEPNVGQPTKELLRQSLKKS